VAATAEERQMIDSTTHAPVQPGDFAAGERTDLPTPEEVLEEGLHGDFAAGERKEPLTPEDDVAATFADSADSTT
jgi:hypothetical protein